VKQCEKSEVFQPSGWNRGFNRGFPVSVKNLFCKGATTKEKSSEAKSALRTPSTTRETLRSFAKPWVYQKADPKRDRFDK